LWLIFLSPLIFFLWIIIIARELSRTPFDLAEGESEIVSGVNTEYTGGLFSFLFIAEYGIIILLSLFSVLLFCGGGVSILIKAFLICTLLVWIRSSLPRVRFDNYIEICWKIVIPFILFFIMC